MRSVAIMSRLQVSVIQMCSSVQTSVRIKHLQWQSPLILMYAVMKDMYVVYMIYTQYAYYLFVCTLQRIVELPSASLSDLIDRFGRSCALPQ